MFFNIKILRELVTYKTTLIEMLRSITFRDKENVSYEKIFVDTERMIFSRKGKYV